MKNGPRHVTATDAQLGMMLKHMRRKKGVSQEKLATAVGVTFQQIQKYEHGTNRISVSRLYEIAQVLGVPVTSMLPELEHALPPPDAGLSNAALSLAVQFDRIPDPNVRARVGKLVQALAQEDA